MKNYLNVLMMNYGLNQTNVLLCCIDRHKYGLKFLQQIFHCLTGIASLTCEMAINMVACVDIIQECSVPSLGHVAVWDTA